MRGALDFVARIWIGDGDQPTEENPVVETSAISGKMQTTVKKVLVKDYDEKVEKLRAASIETRNSMSEALEQVRNMPIKEKAGG